MRTQRGNLGFVIASNVAQMLSSRAKRGNLYGSVIASGAWRRCCHRERSVAISVVQDGQNKRRNCSVPRNDKITSYSQQPTIVIPSAACEFLSSRAERGADVVIASEAWRSRLFRAGKTKREIASQARNDKREGKRSVAISVLKVKLKRRDCFVPRNDRPYARTPTGGFDKKTAGARCTR